MVKNSDPIITDHLLDSHIHTHLCGHAIGAMEEYVQAAIRKGLNKIIFLEHMEEGIRSLQGKTWLSEDDFDNYFSEGLRLRTQNRNNIDIGLGVECGYNRDCCDLLKKRLGKRSWAQIGISCHFQKVEGLNHHLNMFSSKAENTLLAQKIGADKILTRYFADLTEAVCCLPGTMLCHLDGALRNVPGIILKETHYALIDTLLQAVKDNKMSIEINTSGYAIRQEQFPNQRILAMAHNYNIPFILGSDAHKPENVGRYFDVIHATHLSEFYP